MDKIERAKKYCESSGGAVSGNGGHAHTFALACNILRKIGLTADDLFEVLATHHNPQCDPPWTAKELRHKVESAVKACAGQIGSEDIYRTHGAPIKKADRAYKLSLPNTQEETLMGIRYVYRGDLTEPIPGEISDGTRKLLKAAFREGEGVRIAAAFFNQEGKESPDSGISLTLEEWLKKLEDVDGDPNEIFSNEGNPGIYIGINPIEPGETKDEHITCFRHALLEFDDLEKTKQWAIIVESDLPVTAVIDSGKRSIHAWVRIDARDRSEYDERVKAVYDYVADYNPDSRNKNPGRLSRLAGCRRLDSRQKLLALDIGIGTFAEWMSDRAMDGLGQPLDLRQAYLFDPNNDPHSLIGRRYLCRAGSLLIVAPSGVGKSTLATQLAYTWALGFPTFGITPKRPMKSLILQAENDGGDISEQVQGVVSGMNIDPEEHLELWEMLVKNVVYISDTIHTAEAFCSVVSKLIERYKPDIVWIDPLLSFLGGDVSKQEVCSRFLRNGLNPISQATGVVFAVIHHTGKPPKDKKAAFEGWTASDFAYLGSGSSELTNWARAVMALQQIDEKTFALSLVKRGGRAGLTTLSGSDTMTVYLEHSTKGLRWIQIPETSFENDGAGRTQDGQPWFLKKWKGYDVREWLNELRVEKNKTKGFTFAELAEGCRAYSRRTGKGPTGNGSTKDLLVDLQGIELSDGSGRTFLRRYEATNEKRHPKTTHFFEIAIEASFSPAVPINFDDVPPVDFGEGKAES